MNRLAGEPSAYLRQHAQNPVNWQPFDAAAFAESAARDVPIFLSVGYAACHWCHVMADESFQDPAIGAYLNEHFVAIKVDREERPDVDDAYMAATQALSGQGGWPMSVFLTPAGRAFYAGTYFPPRPVPGRPSFTQVLAAVHEAWTERRAEVEQTAGSLAETLSQPLWKVGAAPASPAAVPASGVELAVEAEEEFPDAVAAVAALGRAEDVLYGGFGQAPKFPPTPALEFLLRHAASGAETAEQARGLVGRTLGAMVHSALFDQLCGGFSRYSVTADWSEPHYEKMLYDNAALLQVLVHWIRLAQASDGGRASPDGDGPAPLGVVEARDAAVALISWLMAEMRLPGGAFASSLDADTVIDGAHFEGASYRWTMAELQSAARETVAREVAAGGRGGDAHDLAAAVAAAMGVDAGTGGHDAGFGDAAARPLNPGRALPAGQRLQWARIKPALLAARARRVMPARDEKVVASWNAMLMGALAEAAMVLEEPAYLASAVELGEYLQTVHWDGELSRVSHDGKTRGIKGLLEDYAACAQGYLTLYAATGNPRWFDFASLLVDALEQDFIAEGTVFNHGARDGSAGPLQGSRHADPFDNATASPVALLAGAFVSWAAYTGSHRHKEMARSMLADVPELSRRAPRSAGGLLGVAQAVKAGPLETAVVGPAGPERDRLLRGVWLSDSPGMVIAVWDGTGPAPVPLLEGRSLDERSGGHPAGSGTPGAVTALAYVCRHMVCARPVGTPEELQDLLH
ncbi:thioredoxin domain-containing protein [Arthrobacter sp. LAPM80]|uniref:thioredoxin domain-containing protein n=1 Tax=Arthrobacter sp. LAPM80 TaxID=3141788 RepID=UPI00398A8258